MNHPEALEKDLPAEFPAARVFLVGGAVRDDLLGRPVKDRDYVVMGVPAEALERFLAARDEVKLVGRQFGVFKFSGVDVALPRKDFPSGTGGYRDVETQSDPELPLEEDLARRDFTVNAMARDLRDGRLIDPFGGETDLVKGQIRAVGDPATRFAEDRTRMLRALRFAAQLGFDVEEKTWDALKEGMPRVNDLRPDGSRVVPYEVVAREFIKGFESDAVRTAELWEQSGAFAALMPELGTNVAARFRERLEANGDSPRSPLRIRLARVLAFLGPEKAAALAERLRFASTGHGATPSLMRRIAAGGEAAVRKELGLKPLLDGEAVMRLLGIGPGPEVGEALSLLMDAQAEGKVSSPREAEGFLRKHLTPDR